MIATIEPTVYPDRESWLEARRSCIGASDSAALFGVGYADQSVLTVWDSKVNPVRAEDPAKAKRFRIGKLIEPTLRLIFTEETDLPCESPGEFTIFRHPDHPFIGATLDGYTIHDEYGWCPVELKNVSNFARHEWDEDEPPLKFNVQCQQQMAVTGANASFLLGLIGGCEPVIRIIERNDRFIDAMLPVLTRFWLHVQEKTLPPIDESEATARVLSRLWPDDSGATVALPKEAARWAAERETCKALIKGAEALKTHAENQLKAAIGEATFGDLPPFDEVEAVADVKTRLLAMVEEANVVVPPRYSWKTQVAQIKAVEAHTRTSRVLRNAK